MVRKEDKYNGKLAVEIAQRLYTRNTQEVMQLANDCALKTLEDAYRSGYTQALQDFGIEVYPNNITTKETLEIEE